MAKGTENKGALGMFESIGKVSMPKNKITTEQAIDSELNVVEKNNIEKEVGKSETEKKSNVKISKN